MTERVEHIGPHTLYCADCMDILPTLDKVDAVVTDPPYGIGEAAGKNRSRGKLATSYDYGYDDWDNTPCSKLQIEAMVKISKWQIIWGGNYFELPPSKCMLIWDKENGKTDFADAEIAWASMDMAARLIRHRWSGMLRVGNEKRYHPTQKPLAVMEWCIGFIPDAVTILDPFMGSGTTGVACSRLGRTFIGIEREPKYFDIACERIEREHRQGKLF